MPVRLNRDVRIGLVVPGTDDQAIFIFPPHSDPDMQKAIDVLLDTRQFLDGKKVVSNFTPARILFFDSMCKGVENVVDVSADNQEVDLMTLPDWKDRISPNWKTTIVSHSFEELNTLNGDDVKN